MRYRRFPLLVSLLLASACAVSPQYAPVYPALWRIDKPLGGEMWLFGTVHQLPDAQQPRDGFGLPRHRGRLPVSLPSLPWYHGELRQAIDRMHTLMLEIGEPARLNEVAEATRSDQPLCSFRESPRTAGSDKVGPLLTRFQYTYETPDDTAALLFLLSELQSRLGGDADNVGVEYWLSLYARDQRRQVLALEDVADRAHAVRQGLDGADCPAQRRLVRNFASSLHKTVPGAAGGRAYDIWRRGAMDELGRELRMIRNAEPRLYQALVAGRNRAWLPAIRAQLHRGGNTLVAVGMAHLAGPENLVELLHDAGLRVERVQ